MFLLWWRRELMKSGFITFVVSLLKIEIGQPFLRMDILKESLFFGLNTWEGLPRWSIPEEPSI